MKYLLTFILLTLVSACTSPPKSHIYIYPSESEFTQRASDEKRAQELSIETFLILGTKK